MKKYFMLSVGLISFLIIGFFLGQNVQAGTTDPGTIADPLVSKSYVDTLITKIEALKTQVTALQTKTTALEQKVQYLSSLHSTPTTTTKYATVTAASANIRSGPGTTYSIITTAKSGTKYVYVSQPSKYWYKIKVTSTKYGYVYYNLVSIK